MEINQFQIDLDSIAQQVTQSWWGPSLSAVVSEIETCREYPEYLLAIIQGATDSQHASQLLLAHCDARGRIDLWDSLRLSLQFLREATDPTGFIDQLNAIRGLVREYFRWKPCSHVELLFHMALVGLKDATDVDCSHKMNFLQHLLHQISASR